MPTADTKSATSIHQLAKAGVSIWLDDLNRENIHDGKLATLIREGGVVGVTTNPTIFATALERGEAYDQQLAALKARGSDVDNAVFEITTADVAAAADLLADTYERTHGQDGRVSIEVAPEHAYDTEGTVADARRLWSKVNRPNAMIKIPATQEGLAAIESTIASGISVNVTLIFSLERYREVLDAYLSGLERASAQGRDLSRIHSVASFFVSRVDTEVNRRLDALGTGGTAQLRNRVAVANARLAYHAFLAAFSTQRARALIDAGANVQRPLWASTGVKDDTLAPTFYVTELVGPQSVNTMPQNTLRAVDELASIVPDTVLQDPTAAQRILDALADTGIDLADVAHTLEREGVEKFVASWAGLGETVAAKL